MRTRYDADTKEVELYMVDPAGMSRRYVGCAAGTYFLHGACVFVVECGIWV